MARLVVLSNFQPLLIGTGAYIQLDARDDQHHHVSTSAATVVVSDPGIIKLDSTYLFSLEETSIGRTTSQKMFIFHALAPGQVTITFSLDTNVSSVVLTVLSETDVSNALVVESFEVIEYQDVCAWACPYLIYAPLLKLREPSGRASATVVGVEFTVSGQRTAFCRGEDAFRPGISAHVNGIDPYTWSNDLIIASLNGTPLPSDDAQARLVVRDARGNCGVLNVSGKIRRMVVNPVLPPPLGTAWWCH